jgi:hypothetical protein
MAFHSNMNFFENKENELTIIFKILDINNSWIEIG